MRKITASLFILALGATTHANADQTNAFECMDKTSFEIDSQCMSNKISQNMEFRDMEMTIANQASSNDANALATIKFYPQQMLIEVIAHREESTPLTASVQH